MKIADSHPTFFAHVLIVFACAVSLPSPAAIAEDRPSVFLLHSQAVRDALVQGQIEEALQYYESTARDLEADSRSADPYRSTLAELYVNAAFAAFHSGYFQKAIEYGQEVLNITSSLPRSVAEKPQFRAVSVLIEAYRFVGKYQRSREYIDRGFALVRQFADLWEDWDRASYWEGRLHSKLGAVLNLEGKYREAIAVLSKALALSDGLSFVPRYDGDFRLQSNRGLLILTLRRLGTAHRRLGEWRQALEQYDRALKAIEEWGHTSQYDSGLYAGVGAIQMEQKLYSSALANFKRALELAERRQPNATEVVARSQQIGQLLEKMGNTAAAIPYYVRAAQGVESIRGRLEFDYRASFFGKELSPHVATVEAMSEIGRIEAAFEFSERARSRLFLDLLGHKVELGRVHGKVGEAGEQLDRRLIAIKNKLARGMNPAGVEKEIRAVGKVHQELVSKIRSQDEQRASLMTVEPVKASEVQALLGPDTSLLEYFITERGAHVWVIGRDQIEYERLATSRKELEKSINRLRRAILNVADPADFINEAHSLYARLIRPVLAHIKSRELIIVPHDVLHYLPFHALVSPEGRYLVEDFTVHYLTSASLLKFTKAKAEKSVRQTVLAVGDPAAGGSRAKLSFARSEVQEVKRLYPRATVLTGSTATEASGKRLSSTFDILHFATHAELNVEDPLSSALLLASDQTEDGRLTVKEIFSMELAADLVVLSGCETGLGRLSRGDEIAGLTRAFIYAGTPSVVASLWNVEDRSTAALMGRFYRNLKTMSKADALRQAQLWLMRGGGGRSAVAMRGIGGVTHLGAAQLDTAQNGNVKAFSSAATTHPYFWASFVLVGDGG